MFCLHCGRAAGHEQVPASRAAHAAAGRFCAAAGSRIDAARSSHLAPGADLPGFEHIRAVGLFYGAVLGVILVNTGWGHYTGNQSTTADFVFAGLFYGVILLFAWRWRALLASLCRWPQGDRRLLLVIPLTPLLTLGTVQGQQALVDWIGWPTHSYLSEFTRDGYGFGTALVFVAVLPAVFEEIAFRGLILRKLLLVMPLHQALLVTSLLFAIIHFNVVGMIVFLVPLAYVAGWITEKTGSLLPAMGIHFLHNAGVLWLEHLKS